ncbi:DEAD/DEAH box helicase [Solemya velesiana gill symbiont]|uniref:ATP-dependent RNA helicase DeaD n=1 Tax=Solemya velesiana gill symbiont TaxID=1918948 RepID=A0A1T2KXT0_9GAMM|nr:DEAD/DEAH box helicase [Solemya velesiana gill symbiont]OOZ37658.1 ATP-dependent RNA helicase [Solemya velesiana gill symbiont]
MSSADTPAPGFRDLALTEPVLKALDDVGYETPSPIQAQTIPHILSGSDLLGQAQTGTGKTAAFALPLLSRIDLSRAEPQVLVLAPTRELAIQVAEAFQRYAAHMKGFHVLPIYGGQDYRVQLRPLKRGVHVVVGTPGRVMDHMRKGSLKLDGLSTLVLDEADEMLRMGFIDDVEWILEQTPKQRQIALFSATMPSVIRRIAQKHLNDPEEITIKVKTTTAETIRQRYWLVSGLHKLDALTRILEAEPFDGIITFVRTKTATIELAEKLQARGYATAPLNGDIAQKDRERTVEKLKAGKLDILVATDVAARGLDVERISHVINYDIPYDTEAYVHRIGRTGRAGRSGDAILFVAPRERRLLRAIEKATRKQIELMELPSAEIINDKRIARFKDQITDTLATEELGFFYQLMEQYQQEHNISALEIAAALAKLVQGDQPMLLSNKSEKPRRREKENRSQDERQEKRRERSPKVQEHPVEEGMERFRIEVGHNHEVKPGNIVGAIANEAGLESQYIGHIKIFDDYSLVDLPEGMPNDIFSDLKKTWVCGQKLNISRVAESQKKNTKKKKTKGKTKNKPKRKKSKSADR